MIRYVAAALALFLTLTSAAHEAVAVSDAEKSFLSLYFTEEELVVLAATRSLKAVSRVAENMTVVTAEEIEFMNAHTVAEALYNVTGIEIVNFRGPGASGLASIHGSGSGRVAVLLDGVPLQNANNSVSLGVLPVQMIRKIEIIRGPASATWGSSFGGVINIITKSAEPGERPGGTAYVSGGENKTSDLRAEVRGGTGRVGVYLYGGMLNSEGFFDRHELWHDNLFAKVNLGAGPSTTVDLTFLYHKSDSVNADLRHFGVDMYDAFALETLFGRAGLRRELTKDAELNVSAWWLRQNDSFYARTMSTDVPLRDARAALDKYGVNGSVVWKTGDHTVVVGTDVLHGRLTQGPAGDSIDLKTAALFGNDTISMGRVTLTPGLRFDHSNLGGDFVSPSLGIVYLANENLLFRALVSRGFHDPAMVKFLDLPDVGFIANEGLRPEKIWSYQAGVEANVLGLFNAGFTVFDHEISDIILDKILGPLQSTAVNEGRARTIGGEVEVSTNRYRGLVARCGLHYEQVKLIDHHNTQVFDSSRVYGLNASLHFAGGSGLNALLKAHYQWWNVPGFWEGKYDGVVVDVNIMQKVLQKGAAAVDLFVTGHNIFNGNSYREVIHRNPGRWLEAGMRMRF